jgi:hypothetical protein
MAAAGANFEETKRLEKEADDLEIEVRRVLEEPFNELVSRDIATSNRYHEQYHFAILPRDRVRCGPPFLERTEKALEIAQPSFVEPVTG